MASIVWRWNHPDNRRNQRDGRGYPNKKLLEDLDDFYAFIEEHKETVRKADESYQAKLDAIRHLRTLKVEKTYTEVIDGMMEYYGIGDYRAKRNSLRGKVPSFTENFISSIESHITIGNTLSEKQVQKMIEILEPPTDKQIQYMNSLGMSVEGIRTKLEASFLINERVA